MGYNHTQNYFFYRDKMYGVGTVVKIKPGGKYTSQQELKRCNGIAKFEKGLSSGYFDFVGIMPPGSRRCGLVVCGNLDDRIEEIIEPVYYEYKPIWQVAMGNYQKTPKTCRADIAPGTIFYIAALLVGALFKGAIAIWIIATFFYIKYLVNIYRD